MSSEPIELTDEDRVAAVRALTNRPDARAMAEAESRVYLVINAINRARAGDPVGTLRRSPDGGVYERREKRGRRFWESLMAWPQLGIALSTTVPADPEGLSDWPVIYRPDGPA